MSKYDACNNCLKTRHAADVCEKKRPCIINGCREKHHGNLHNRKDFQNALQLLKEEKDNGSPSKNNNQNAAKTLCKPWVFIKTRYGMRPGNHFPLTCAVCLAYDLWNPRLFRMVEQTFNPVVRALASAVRSYMRARVSGFKIFFGNKSMDASLK